MQGDSADKVRRGGVDWQEKVSLIWSIKEVLRDHYKRHQYGEVILPFCVLRRLDCVLEPTKHEVLERAASIPGDLDSAGDVLAHASGEQFYNTSKFTLTTLLGDQHHVGENMHDYVNGFSVNARDVFARFDLPRHIDKMDEAGILYLVTQRFAQADLHPDNVPTTQMGYIYEELVRVTADLSNEEAGEHFTPREVIELMVNLVFADDRELLTPAKIQTVFDPACGTGGMLSEAEAHVKRINPSARLHLYGQELQPESYAVCRSDMMLKGHKADNVVFGDSFTNDGFPNHEFDYMLANPPYGKDWKSIEKQIKAEQKSEGYAGRFGAGLPRPADGQLLFLQHMISKMRPPDEGGSRIAVVFNGSPLFAGDAGKGESNIRRWIIENDWLEAIVGLPDQLFYNTGIYTYVWVVTNRKRPERQGVVQLIDARELYAKMKRSLGNKRNELAPEHIAEITLLYEGCVESERSKVLSNTAFGYRKVIVERPLRVRYKVTDDAVDGVGAVNAIAKLDETKRSALIDGLRTLVGNTYDTSTDVHDALAPLFTKVGKVTAPIKKAITSALMVKDPDAPPVSGRSGGYEPDTELRDGENVPLDEEIDDFIAREVLPFVPDAWVDETKTKIGYEIPFTRQFYKYVPPRPLDEIDADIRASQRRILELLAEVTE